MKLVEARLLLPWNPLVAAPISLVLKAPGLFEEAPRVGLLGGIVRGGRTGDTVPGGTVVGGTAPGGTTGDAGPTALLALTPAPTLTPAEGAGAATAAAPRKSPTSKDEYNKEFFIKKLGKSR